jgi:hypothetical protein
MIKNFNTTGIGSLPYTDPVKACEFIVQAVDIPFWPQLPKRGFHELMIPQYAEGFPYINIFQNKIWVERDESGALNQFYEAISAGQDFPISQVVAAGFYAFMDLLKTKGLYFNAIKGHATGPLTFTLTLADQEKTPIYFNEELRELAVELLKGKIRWQIRALKPFASQTIIFIDEPVMSALGSSAYVGVDTEEALRLLKSVVAAVQEAGAVAGIHVCSKTDWKLVIDSGIDILNFDAYGYAYSLHLYPQTMIQFLERGGIVAWGIVPTSESVRVATVDSLKIKLETEIANLKKFGIPEDKLRNQSLLTPSCGTGSLGMDDNQKVFELLRELRNEYVF